MFCPSCKRKNQTFNNYCYYCGYRLKDKSEAIDSVQAAQDDNQEPTPEIMDMDKSMEDIPAQDITVDKPLYHSFYDYPRKELYGTQEPFGDRDPLKDDITSDFDDDTTSDFDDDITPDFDLDLQMPLRRYQKDVPPPKSSGPLKLFLTALSLIVVAIVVIFKISQFGQQGLGGRNSPKTIAVSASVESTIKDGEKAYRIIFNTVNGREVSFLGDIKNIENGRAEFIVEESALYAYNPQLTEDEKYKVELNAIISAPSLAQTIEKVSIILSEPYNYAPFKLLSPVSSETEFQGDSSKVSFKIEKGSTVIINQENLTDLVLEDGRFEKEFSLLPQEDELILNIRVSTPGCLDNIQQVILRRTPMDVYLDINGTSPITSNEEWIKVTGTIEPNAILEADVEIFEEPRIDSDTGNFTIYLKGQYPGYNRCILTAKLDDKESSVEIILERKTTADTYTSTAWKPEYDQLQRSENHSNGRHFVFTGKIKDIIETGNKNIFTVGLSEQSDSEELFYVEYWGGFDFNIGDKIRVFGNRWGNKNNIPRFLAKYIYR